MEIIPGVHQVNGVNANSYIIVRETLTIIDTGLPGSGTKILTYLTDELKRNPADISSIILTHAHMDHIGGVMTIRRAAPGAKVAVHAADAGYLRGTVPMPSVKGVLGFLMKVVGVFVKPAPVEPDLLLAEGDRIDGLVCLHLPGHSPGSIGLLDEATRTLFVGDLLRYDGDALSEGPRKFTQDLKTEQASIRRIADLDLENLLVGHGVPLTGAAEKVRAFAGTLL